MFKDERQAARAFNEWMRRYTDHPEQFASEFQTVGEFLAQTAAGQAPTYGEVCIAYLNEIASSLPDQSED